jgi:tetratricopeptide (TPR) repeat protein
MSGELAKLQSSPREVARWQKAQQQLMGRRFAAALAGYRDIVKRFSSVAQLWFELGMAAMGELEFNLADQSFRRAMELSAKDAQMLILLAQQYQRLRRLDQARRCFELAAAADPSSAHAQVNLALWHEKDRQLDRAWEVIEACITSYPHDSHALYVKALLLQRKDRSAEAETLLRDLVKRDSLDPNVRVSSRYLLAEILDEAGQYAEALHQLLDAKYFAQQTVNVKQLEQEYDLADARRRELVATLPSGIVQRWRQEIPHAMEPCRLVFLGGHPRSGTTLLEQILGAHPEVRAFDEPVAFVTEIWDQLAPMNAPHTLTLNELNSLNASRRAEMRRRYLKSLLREVEGEPGAKILLVKDPSPTMALYLWLRIFPELKVIIAIRDPRDVLISCFFQNLALTATNVNFLSLDRAAKHYADLMDVWLRVRELGGFDWIQVGYRDIVTNLAGEGRRATEFLQLAWHEEQAKFHESAHRKFLFSPTYQDVTRPLQNRSVDRWKNYAEALAPVQARLAPYCRAFGFDEPA